jgi:hypothetical protein
MSKPKLKHNKKRNTAFLYEALVKELTKATVEKNEIGKKQIVGIIKEFFSTGKLLAKELDVYKTLYETDNVDDRDMAKSLLGESKRVYFSMNQQDIFNEQSKLIGTVNKTVGPSVFKSFMPNYRNLATIAQIFDIDIPIKTRIILEQNLIDFLISEEKETKTIQPIDNIVFKTFVNKFNDKYNGTLLEEQKKLLTHFIMAQDGMDLDFKIYINEELGRIKNIVSNSTQVKSNPKYGEINEMFESFKSRQIDNKYLEDIMYLQVLAKEIE